ncbi:glutamate racemase [Desulfitispora alkaliphila]|uniref:glutamate racemase n=1 Tax=Desulfitispora alkaliphila TaxID=622674 RepID=UPI003D2484D2
MTDKQVKVGIFDSGIGGLTVAKEVFNKLPHVPIAYLGDTAHVPYGGRSVEQLIILADRICQFLIEQGANLIIAACNTSSSVSLDYLEEKYPGIPILGVVKPGVQEAARITKNNKVGLIATEATVKSQAHKNLIKNIKPEVDLYAQACPKFVPLIEAGNLTGPAAESAVEEYICKLNAEGIDTLILGCTHYPFLSSVISKYTGQEVSLVDPARTTVEDLIKYIGKTNHGNDVEVEHEFYATGSAQSFFDVGCNFISTKQMKKVEQVDLGCGF